MSRTRTQTSITPVVGGEAGYPSLLYHGTRPRQLHSILKRGLFPHRQALAVHRGDPVRDYVTESVRQAQAFPGELLLPESLSRLTRWRGSTSAGCWWSMSRDSNSSCDMASQVSVEPIRPERILRLPTSTPKSVVTPTPSSICLVSSAGGVGDEGDVMGFGKTTSAEQSDRGRLVPMRATTRPDSIRSPQGRASRAKVLRVPPHCRFATTSIAPRTKFLDKVHPGRPEVQTKMTLSVVSPPANASTIYIVSSSGDAGIL